MPVVLRRVLVVQPAWLWPQLLVVCLANVKVALVSKRKVIGMPESPPRRYFVCNRPGHLAKDCYQCVGAPAAQRGGSRGAGSYSHQFGSRGNRGGAHVKLCTTREPV